MPPPPVDNPRFKFIKKNLGRDNNDSVSNMREFLDKYNHIFLKLDIEGGEYDLFSSFSDADLQKFEQIVIELHSASRIDVLQRLCKTHWLVHFHPNNCCGTSQPFGVPIPNIYECTFVLKRHAPSLELNKTPIPDPNIDMRNVVKLPEIELKGYPFVN